jgi:hypothetical protein
MTRNETYKITHRLYGFLRNHSHTVAFKKLRGACGLYYGEGKIELDYRKDVLATLVHECLHHWHEDWCETKVLIEERRIMNALSPRQIKNIIRVMGNTICR